MADHGKHKSNGKSRRLRMRALRATLRSRLIKIRNKGKS